MGSRESSGSVDLSNESAAGSTILARALSDMDWTIEANLSHAIQCSRSPRDLALFPTAGSLVSRVSVRMPRESSVKEGDGEELWSTVEDSTSASEGVISASEGTA